MNNSQIPTTSAYPIDVIIPAYNEGDRIGRVISTLNTAEFINEIIVINDGSIDSTAVELARLSRLDPRLRIQNHDINMGKGQAIFTGINATQSPYIILLDADLIGLTVQHIWSLIQPVIQSNMDMTLGIFHGGQLATDLSHRLTPWLTGQRGIRAELFQKISKRAAAGYGLETALTVASRQQQWRCVNVTLNGVSHTPSEYRRGFWKGVRIKTKMYFQIVNAWHITRDHHDMD
jgi:glycosyltransferase involved in cell wall biosynthesis